MRPSSVIANTLKPLPAQFAPVSGYTWELQAQLLGSEIETPRIPIDMRGPVEILGFYPSISMVGEEQTGSTLLNAIPRKPTTDDVLVMIDINQEVRLTNRLESTQIANPLRSFVTLASLGVQVPRLVRAQLFNARPDVGIQFRWAQDNPDPEQEIYHDAMIKLAFYCRYLPLEVM